MQTEISKITSKGQITIPLSIRKELEVSEGDKLVFQKKGSDIIIKKSQSVDVAYYKNIQKSFSSEWNSKADSEAYDDL